MNPAVVMAIDFMFSTFSDKVGKQFEDAGEDSGKHNKKYYKPSCFRSGPFAGIELVAGIIAGLLFWMLYFRQEYTKDEEMEWSEGEADPETGDGEPLVEGGATTA